MDTQKFHTRSVSLPSESQPDALRIEEDIKALKTSVASSSCATPEKLSNSLKEISNIYESMEIFLQLPSNQQMLCTGQNKKWMDKELDQSIKVLDICSNVHDYLVLVKDQAREHCLAFRRKDKSLESVLKAYARSLKKAQMDIRNSFKSFRKYQEKYSEIYIVVRMFIELREVSTSLLQSVFSFYSMPKPEAKRWFFISKNKRVACLDDNMLEYPTQMESLDQLENGLDSLFRQLILNRVSLLNKISL